MKRGSFAESDAAMPSGAVSTCLLEDDNATIRAREMRVCAEAPRVSPSLSTAVWQSCYFRKCERRKIERAKLYLFGGLVSGQGQVQIYNPATNTWTLGTPAPWAAGSMATALIGGKVYAAGGIVGTTTVNTAGVYNPT